LATATAPRRAAGTGQRNCRLHRCTERRAARGRARSPSRRPVDGLPAVSTDQRSRDRGSQPPGPVRARARICVSFDFNFSPPAARVPRFRLMPLSASVATTTLTSFATGCPIAAWCKANELPYRSRTVTAGVSSETLVARSDAVCPMPSARPARRRNSVRWRSPAPIPSTRRFRPPRSPRRLEPAAPRTARR
jgi:hypothetical protein